MESREGLASGVAVIGGEAPPTYHAAPRTENSNQISPVAVELTETKKRGRPRKYGPDGSVLSPMPTSSSAPPAGYFSSGKSAGKVWSGSFGKKKYKKMGMEHSGTLCSFEFFSQN